MDNPRPAKVATVNEVKERFADADATLLTEYRGLSVKALADLRRQLKAVGGEYKIYKNTLVRFAARDHGGEGLDVLLTGPTAITFVKGDAAAAAKALRDYSRTNPHLVLKGGLLGTKVLAPTDVAALAELPPRDVMLARLAGAFQAPLTKFAGLLQALPRNFAFGLKALIDERVAAGEAPPPESTAAEPSPDAASAADASPATAPDVPDASPADAASAADASPESAEPAPTATADMAAEPTTAEE